MYRYYEPRGSLIWLLRARANLLWLILFIALWLISSGLIFFGEQLNFVYALIPFVLILGLLLFGVRVLQVTYHLRSFFQAFQYLFAALFTIGYPVLEVRDGAVQIPPLRDHAIERLGGPGYLIVQSGCAVLLEHLDGGIRVIGTGRHFIMRREFIKEVVSLEERDAEVEKMVANSKDGIYTEVRKVHYRYRIYRTPIPPDDRLQEYEDGYPFSDRAVRNMVYNRTVNEKGVISWQTAINFPIDTVVTDFINQHSADYLSAPESLGRPVPPDPRQEILDLVQGGQTRNTLRDRGADLIWIDIGAIEIPEKKVLEERIKTWSTRWIGSANAEIELGKAQRQSRQELGRAEAQAELLRRMVDAMPFGMPPVDLRRALLIRLSSILETMRQKSNDNLPPWV